MKKKLCTFLIILFTLLLMNVSFIFARGWEQDGIGWRYYDYNDVMRTETIQASNGKKYYLDANGYVVYDYLLEDYNGATYYFNDDGEMVTNTWVAVDPHQVENQMGNPPSVYLYYFGGNGKAYKANGISYVRKTIDGKPYLFNDFGQMLSGWISDQGERYDEYNTEEDPFVGNIFYGGDETDGVLRSGWFELVEGSITDAYYERTSLWFYFNKRNNKKVFNDTGDRYITKRINNKTYAFDENGVMFTGWDADPENKFFHDEDTNKKELGVLTRKEWIFTVPSEEINARDYAEDTMRWFYSLGNGQIAKNCMRKINSLYFAFNKTGIMRAGIVLFDKNTKEYVDSVDIENTDGTDYIVSRYFMSAETEDFQVFDDKKHVMHYFESDETKPDYGAKKNAKQTIYFADADYEFGSNTKGAYNGLNKKTYYQAGVKLTADANLGFGLVLVGYKDLSNGSIIRELSYINSPNPFANEDEFHDNNKNDYIVEYIDPNYIPVFIMVDKRGQRVHKVNGVKKDKEKYNWLIDENGLVEKILEVDIKYVEKDRTWYYKSQDKAKHTTKWLKMATATDPGETDGYGRCASTVRGEGDYEIYIDNTYAVNFRLKAE